MSDLAWAAMRCAPLMTRLGARDGSVDRTGAGKVAEVYPGAVLRRWGLVEVGALAQSSYKGDAHNRRQRREIMVDKLGQRLAGSVDLPPDVVAACVDDDDALDTVISSLVARAVELGLSDPIPRGMRWQATRVGWIHLPAAGSLERARARRWSRSQRTLPAG